jgi:hypothetical protein
MDDAPLLMEKNSTGKQTDDVRILVHDKQVTLPNVVVVPKEKNIQNFFDIVHQYRSNPKSIYNNDGNK